MGLRPRTKFVKKLKARRCSGCGAKLNTQKVRCPRCSTVPKRAKKGNKRSG
jgi:hypothetical protein